MTTEEDVFLVNNLIVRLKTIYKEIGRHIEMISVDCTFPPRYHHHIPSYTHMERAVVMDLCVTFLAAVVIVVLGGNDSRK